MKLTLILLLFLWDNVEFTLTHQECSRLPTFKCAVVPDEYKKAEYQRGDVIYCSCDPGYTTGVNTTYICTEDGWRAATYGQCIEEGTFLVRLGCARPPALKNGYVLNNSTHFYGDGQRVQYRCDHLYELKRGPHKTCSNGQWTGDLHCLANFCEKPMIDNGTLEEDKEKYGPNEVLLYSCNPGYRKVDSRPSVCLKVDSTAAAAPQWSPMPQCEATTCKLSSNPPEGTAYNPQDQTIFRPGQTVTVSCGEKQWVKSTELQSAELTCQDTGDWDFEPVCKLVTCSKMVNNVNEWQHTRFHTVNIDETLSYQCYPEYEATSPTATCTRRGWEPSPLCKERRCTKPSYRNVEITNGNQKDEYEHKDRVHLRCTSDPTVTFYVDCFYGEWRGYIPTCKAASCPSVIVDDNKVLVSGDLDQPPPGSVLQFSCRSRDDELIGPTQIVCGENGNWDNNPPTCSLHKSTFREYCKLQHFKESPFYDENFEVADLRQGYSRGDIVEVPCRVGFTGFFRLICSDRGWTNHGDKCRPISCGHPGDVPFADFQLVYGTDYVFGSQVQYTCHRGYQMTSYTSTRNCLLGGWDGHLPECERE